MIKFNVDAIPNELKKLSQWVVWRSEVKDGRQTKIPYDAKMGNKASSTTPQTWCSFDEAAKKFTENGHYDGVGFVFSDSDSFCGIDWDDVRDPQTGEFDQEILAEIKSLNSYAELSPSGKGAHAIIRGTVPGKRNRKGCREIYDKDRYFTMTGVPINGSPEAINAPSSESLQAIYDKIDVQTQVKEEMGFDHTEPDCLKYGDEELIQICRHSFKSQKFRKLFDGATDDYGDDDSAADLALCDILAKHTRDFDQIDRIFKRSGLFREKWDRPDYKQRTIRKALENIGNKEQALGKSKYLSNNGKLLVQKISESIMNSCHFITFRDTGEIYQYAEGIYKPNGEQLIAYLVQSELGDHSRRHHIDEVINYIKIATYVDRDSVNNDINRINVLNGIYNIQDDVLEPHAPDIICLVQIPVIYSPNADCPEITKFLGEVMLPEDIPVLEEWAGYMLTTETSFQKSVMLYGDGANGKSTLLELITTFVGENNISGESLHRLENDNYSVANLYGKLVNVFPDLANTTIYQNSIFKSITGGDRLRGEKKYKDVFYFNNTAKLMFSANQLPAVPNGGHAYFRRWILISFPNKFEGTKEDRSLIGKLTTPEELSGFFNIAVSGLRRLRKNNQFSYSRSTEEVKREYIIKSDPVAAFADEWLIYSEEPTPKMVMYGHFSKWCKEHDVATISEGMFGKRMKKLGYADKRQSTGDRLRCWENVTIKGESVHDGEVNMDEDNRDQ
ncbi:phage/plasmid primase, P4 family [Methanococcoides seepicolus]|uniref:SF3 helicase domain-containing protein n=1 Tax=Methanococcoides seepicolus TaxID=2828780 RepID=A0A9E4ZED2_9EURY|nr:phage/plasmid primase, P4 family [Methanococcoides seepicolus]MCM1986041.1 hypothetical protein [Methanococcoides seepicolus]